MDQTQLKELLDQAIAAACLAGHYAMKQYRVDMPFSSKGDDASGGDYLTEVDLHSQELIIEALSGGDEGFGMLAEESALDAAAPHLEGEYFWCIDPLDGTRAFVEYNNGFAISIALVSREGQSQLGCIYMPAFNDLYYAAKGLGAFKNGKSVRMGDVANQSFCLFTTRSELLNPQHSLKVDSILQKLKENHDIKKLTTMNHAGCVCNGCWVYDKAPALFFGFPREKGISIWDLAGVDCFIRESGGWISDIFGNPLELNRADNTYMHHRGFVVASDKKLGEDFVAAFKAD
jgi:3'-phosphoadenosine 5'-phosphosulfate (PAPS) 3'-phosphatase